MSFYIKTNRVFNPIRKYSWIFTILVAIGGLWYPRLGLLVIPIMLTLITLSFFKGRYWCGNFCSHGSLFDNIFMPLTRNKKIPAIFKSRITAALFFLFFGFNLTRKFIAVSGLWGKTAFWDRLGFIFVASYLMVLIVGGLLAVIYSPRTWCNFCPMGVIQVLSYKLGKLLRINKKTDQKVTISNQDMCHTCGKCARVCPLQLTPYLAFSDKNQFDSEVCIRCSTCVVNCPAGILSLNPLEDAIALKQGTSNEGYQHRVAIQARIGKIRKLAADVREFTFKIEKPTKVHYQPGQFILVKIQDQPIMYRAYSISGFDEKKGELTIAVKKMNDGYGTNIIFDKFKEGLQVELEGPIGHELIVSQSAKRVVLVAGGIGITPFVPIVKDLIKNRPDVSEIDLIYGVNKANEFLYDEELEALAKKSAKFNFTKVVAFDDSWQGQKGFVTDVMKDMNLLGTTVYMCGPKPMTNAASALLTKAGVNDQDVFMESA